MYDPSQIAYEPTGELHARFWQEATPVEILTSHLKRMVFHKFQGHPEEFEFLKFLARDAKALQSLLLLSSEEKFLSADKVNEMIDKLECPWFQALTSKVLRVSPKVEKDFCHIKAVEDPFLSQGMSNLIYHEYM